MNPDALCMGCMSERGAAEVCSRCKYIHGTPAETPLLLPPGTVLNGNFLIGRKLGQGGFGITYVAYDFRTNQRLAIKEYFPREISTRGEDHHTVSPISRADKSDLEYGLTKFAEEAHALAQFKDHQGIVSFLDFFYANGTGYIVMGYVDGDTLRRHLEVRGEKIPFADALKILSQVMKALEDIHSVGILHRDISPDNIYIEQNGNVKILDFGAAKQALGEQSRSLSVVLRPGYAPEEQYRRRGSQGPWTDIYALGATFYRSITGKVPSESLDRMQHDDLVTPRQLGVVMPAKSEAALLKALAVKAENRFRAVSEFRGAISRGKVPGPVVVRVVIPGRIPDKDHPSTKQLSKPFFLVSLAVIFVTLLWLNLALGMNVPYESQVTDGAFVAAEMLPLFALFALMVFMFHRMWKSIEDGQARTTAGKAVGFCFIPAFNLYWAFPVMWGFAVDYNRYLSRHRLERANLPAALFLIATIVYVITCVLGPSWNGLFSFLIVVNAVLLGFVVVKTCDAVNGLGQHPQPAMPPPPQPPARAYSLYCILGEYQGHHLPVSAQAIVIGRSSVNSNLVLSSEQVSSAHVKVWRDAQDTGVWIEDLNSTNGTFYRKATSAGLSTGWVQLSGSKLLSVGDHFQLSQGQAEFEVKMA